MAKSKREEALELHASIVAQIRGLAGSVMPEYEEFAEKVMSENITDINIIERKLDNMIEYCFDEKILILYKKILEKIYPQAPEVVEFHVNEYYEIYKTDDVDFELEGSKIKYTHKSIKERIEEFFSSNSPDHLSSSQDEKQ